VEWLVSQPITMGEMIDGNVELELSDGDSLPLNDIDWGNDFVMYDTVPARTTKSKPTNNQEE